VAHVFDDYGREQFDVALFERYSVVPMGWKQEAIPEAMEVGSILKLGKLLFD
jgi:hypothetical protein